MIDAILNIILVLVIGAALVVGYNAIRGYNAQAKPPVKPKPRATQTQPPEDSSAEKKMRDYSAMLEGRWREANAAKGDKESRFRNGISILTLIGRKSLQETWASNCRPT
jgi:hypothetical protein